MSGVRSPSPFGGDPVKPRLFALIIGINQYKVQQFSTLRGAAADALTFKSYLEDDLRVPADQIKVLLNEQATRSNILEAFDDMATNPLILIDDPIVIFYAGHGTEQVEAANSEVKIQMLVPHDFSSEKGSTVGTITDRQIERLIGNIAAQKGDNITVILDCCHSASGTRDCSASPSAPIVRSIEIEESSDASLHGGLSRDANLNLNRPKKPSRTATLDYHRPAGLQSHMLIAACGASEQAKEINGHGNFSVALLRLLKMHPPDRLRYCDILTQMDAIHGQNPQCEGKNQQRILFNAKVPSPSRSFPVKFGETTPEGHMPIIVEAGSAQGVTQGTEFALYAADDCKLEERLVVAKVKSVTSFAAVLDDLTQFTVSLPSIAVQTRAGQKEDFRLFVPDGDEFHELFESIRDNEANLKYDLHNITLVPEKNIAHLQATINNTDVLIELTDERVTRYGLNQELKAVDIHDIDRMGWTFGRIAHYFRELNRANSDPKLTSRIHIEFYALKENDNEEFDASGENVCLGGAIDITVDEEMPYGMKLINESPYDLYPYLFWFSNTDLSITECYLSPSLSNIYQQDIPLRRRKGEVNGELTIGYGFGSGYKPFCFSLADRQNLDVGFFKLFISTRSIDLSYIPQSSPFTTGRGLGEYRPKRKVDRWDTILIPVVQRRDLSNGNS